MSAFAKFVTLAANGEPLSKTQMQSAMTLLLQGDASEAQAAAFLAALKVRGETIDEIVAAALAMRQEATRITITSDAVDTCGTGGDGANTYNISTAAALIAAGAGIPIAKHGNKAASSKSGSSDILSALGVNLQASPQTITKCIDDAGIGFLFAAFHHKAVANVASVRTKLGTRTLFNVLGPLTNPAGAKRHIMGVFSENWLHPLAGALNELGVTHTWVVHGSDGLDELTTTGKSHVVEVKEGKITAFDIHPDDAGLTVGSIDELRGGTPKENADALKRVLDGEKNAYRDIAVLNAAAAIIVGGKTANLKDAAKMAQTSIDDGHARNALARLVALTNTDN